MTLPEWLRKGESQVPPPGAGAPEPEPEAEAEPEFDLEIEDEAPGGGDDTPREDETSDAPATGNDQVLGMLAQIERQLRNLGSIQQQHEDQLASLVDHPGAETAGDPAPPREREHPGRQASFVVEMEDGGPASATEAAEQLAVAQGQIEELVKRADATHAELESRTQELARANDELEALRPRAAELEQQVAEGGDAQRDPGEVDELKEQIARLREELGNRDAARGAGAPAPAVPPDGGATQEMLERQRKQIERLTDQLSALNAGADPVEIQERDDRIAELEADVRRRQGTEASSGVGKLVAGFGDALRQVRGRKGAPDDREELEEKIADLEVECERLGEQARRAAEEAEQARRLLQERTAAAELNGDGAESDDAGEVSALRARVAELESELEAERLVADGSDGAVDAFRQRIKQLEKELARAREGGQLGPSGEQRLQQAAEVKEQWALLRKEQQQLAASEKELIHKWARPRAAVVSGWLAALAAVVFGASWLMAGRFFPAAWTATVNVEAESRRGRSVDGDAAADWQLVHTAMLSDDDFHEAVAKRLANQRFDRYGDPRELGERLRKDLTVDVPRPGALSLHLAGTDRREIAAVLDTVATTLAAESARKAGRRSDGAVAVVRGERHEKGQLRWATLGAKPIRDRRLPAAAVFFLLGFAGSVVLISRVYRWLLNAKRAAADEGALDAADLL